MKTQYLELFNQLLSIYRDASLNDRIVQPQEVITLIDLFGLLWCELAARNDAKLQNDIALSLQYIGFSSNDPVELAKHMRREMTNLNRLFRRCGDDAEQLKITADSTRRNRIGACAHGVMRCIHLLHATSNPDLFTDLVSPFLPILSEYLMETRDPF